MFVRSQVVTGDFKKRRDFDAKPKFGTTKENFASGVVGLVGDDDQIKGTKVVVVVVTKKPEHEKHLEYGENGRQKRKIFDNSLFSKKQPVVPTTS